MSAPEAASTQCEHGILAQSCKPCSQLFGVTQMVADARQKVKDANTVLESALVEERNLKTLLNSQNDPVVGGLPTEIASRIFEFCIPTNPTLTDCQELDAGVELPGEGAFVQTRPIQLDLGAICKSWRQVVWANPRFWCGISIVFTALTDGERINLIYEWLTRSSNLPLVIRVEVSEEVERDTVLSLINTLDDFATQWYLFFIQIPSSYYEEFDSYAKNLQALTVTGIYDDNDDTIPRWTLCTPCLSFLRITPFQHVRLDVDWAKMTHISLNYITPNECIKILQSAPLLTDCSFDAVNSYLPLNPTTPHIHHENLESISICPHAGLFQHLSLPSIDEITCHLNGSSFAEVLACFVIRSGCKLVDATFIESSHDDEDLVNFLDLVPSLYRLRLENIAIGDVFLRRLAETSFTINDAPQFLPKLAIFRIADLEDRRKFSWAALAALAMKPPVSVSSARPLGHLYIRAGNAPKETNTDLDIDVDSLEKIVSMARDKSLAIWDRREYFDFLKAFKKLHDDLYGREDRGV